MHESAWGNIDICAVSVQCITYTFLLALILPFSLPPSNNECCSIFLFHSPTPTLRMWPGKGLLCKHKWWRTCLWLLGTLLQYLLCNDVIKMLPSQMPLCVISVQVCWCKSSWPCCVNFYSVKHTTTGNSLLSTFFIPCGFCIIDILLYIENNKQLL